MNHLCRFRFAILNPTMQRDYPHHLTGFASRLQDGPWNQLNNNLAIHGVNHGAEKRHAA